MGLDPAELHVGLVLFMEPTELIKHDAICSAEHRVRVRGVHPFLCVERRDGESYWTPLFSRDGTDRKPLPRCGRQGQHGWKSAVNYYHPLQIWRASDEAVIAAACADMSRRGERNRVDPKWVPKLAEFPTL